METLGFYYLPSDNLLQIFTSMTILILVAFGIYGFDKNKFRLSLLDIIICIPYMLLVINFVEWNNIIRNMTNILVIIISLIGLYGYMNLNKESK